MSGHADVALAARPTAPRASLPALMLAISGSDLLCLGLRGGGCGTYRAAARPHFGSRLVSVVARAADVHRLGDGDRGRRLPGVPRPTHRHRARPGRAQPLGARLRRARAGPSVALRRVGRMLFDGSGGGDPVTRGAGGQLAAVVWQVKANDGMVAVPHRFRRRLSWVHQHSVRAAGPGQADRVARALAAARRRRLGDRLNTLVRALHLVAGAAILSCAAAIAVAPSAPGWWRPLAIVGAAIGLGAFVVFYDGQARLLVVEGAIGAVASLILLVTAIAIPEAFR